MKGSVVLLLLISPINLADSPAAKLIFPLFEQQSKKLLNFIAFYFFFLKFFYNKKILQLQLIIER